MDKCREAFEKLPEINAILHGSEFGFNESINQYYHPHHTEHRLNYAFLMGAWSVWQSRQAEVDELSSQNQILKEVAESDTKTIERLESVINLNDSELKDKDKRIEAALNHLNDVRNKGTDQSCYLAIKALRGNNANS